MEKTDTLKAERRNKKKQDRKFVHRAALISLIPAVCLVLLCCHYLKNQVGNSLDEAVALVESGQYDRAESVIAQLQANSSRMTDEQSSQCSALLSQCAYGRAMDLFSAGDYDGAETAFAAMGEYEEAVRYVYACRYERAKQLEAQKAYAEAAEVYLSANGYEDSLTRYDECHYQIATETEQAGNLQEAMMLFLELGSFSDAQSQAERIAVTLTGVQDTSIALELAQGHTLDEMQQKKLLESIRLSLPGCVLATGFYHTAGLNAGGTVVACGRNEEGQCDVSSWSGIIAVSAGAYHTVGLCGDGTVVATGRNTEGQCDVTEWTDITAIACADYGTIGLKKDGTVVYCGFQKWEALNGWQNMTSVCGGSFMAVGIRDGGTVMTSHETGSDSVAQQLLKGAVAIDCDTGYILGLTAEGTVVSTFESEASHASAEWKNCIAIAASSNGYMAIDSDGKLFSVFFEERNAFDLSAIPSDGKIVALAMGATHAAFLLSDGSVIAVGLSGDGQCDTGDWKLLG